MIGIFFYYDLSLFSTALWMANIVFATIIIVDVPTFRSRLIRICTVRSCGFSGSLKTNHLTVDYILLWGEFIITRIRNLFDCLLTSNIKSSFNRFKTGQLSLGWLESDYLLVLIAGALIRLSFKYDFQHLDRPFLYSFCRQQ